MDLKYKSTDVRNAPLSSTRNDCASGSSSSILTTSRITSVTSVTSVILLVTLVTLVTSVTLVTLVISFVINSFVILKTTGIGGGGGIRTTTVDCLNVSTTPLVR